MIDPLNDLHRFYDGPVPYWEKSMPSMPSIADRLREQIKFHQQRAEDGLAAIGKIRECPRGYDDIDEAIASLKSRIDREVELAQWYRDQLAALTRQASICAE